MEGPPGSGILGLRFRVEGLVLCVGFRALRALPATWLP